MTSTIGRPRTSVAELPAYKPGKAATDAEQEHGIANAIKLASNEGPWGPLPSVQEALAANSSDINRYADPRAAGLRAAIGQWIGVDADQVTVGCGSVGLIQQLFLTYVDPGDEVLYPWISFEVYPMFTQLMAGVAINPELSDHAVNLDAVAAAISKKTKLIILANPNNPTGTAFSTTAMAEFLRSVPSDIVVVLDEAYHEFVDPALGDSITELLTQYDNLVVLRTFSKAQGLAALRIGYAVASAALIATIDRTALPFAVNGQAQAAALASVAAHDEVMERVQIIRNERDRMSTTLRHQGWTVPASEANFVYLPLAERTSQVHLELEKVGLVTRAFPGVGLRITVSQPDDNDRVLALLAGIEPA